MIFMADVIPVQMTFEGRNFDILVGLTAPIIVYLMARKKVSDKVVIVWNVLGLLLVLNIVVVAILSAPLPFRQFMNEPSNTVVAYFPFVWLPSFVVPVAYYMHFLSMRQILKH